MNLAHMLLEICATQDFGTDGKYCVRYILTKSRAITLNLLVAAKHETPGAQLHMLVNIPVKFYECGSYSFRDMRDTRFWD